MHAPARFLTLPCLALCAGLILQACSAPKKVRLVARVGTLAIDGDISAHSKRRDVGGKVSVGKLGLDNDDNEVRALPRLDLDWEKLHLSIKGLTADYSGTGTATDDLAIGEDRFVRVHIELPIEDRMGVNRARFKPGFLVGPAESARVRKLEPHNQAVR